MESSITTIDTKNISSFRVGGEAKAITVTNDEELLFALSYAKENGLRPHITGEGTNSFFEQDLTDLLLIRIAYRGIEIREHGNDVFMMVSAGETWDKISAYAALENWWGIENLSGIPGSVGAAPVQNIGAYGVELKETLNTVRAYDTVEKKFGFLAPPQCDFAYRDSLFKKEPGRFVITHIELKLSTIPLPRLSYKPLDTLASIETPTTMAIRELVLLTRAAKLPDYTRNPNCGSFFKNVIVSQEKIEDLKKHYPDMPTFEQEGVYKIPTAWLVEHVAEMKAIRVGDVGTWPGQPLVIVNYGNATTQDILDFSKDIADKIFEKAGITLEREVNLIA